MAAVSDLSEKDRVWYRRFDEARAYGIAQTEARLFADSDVDIGLLRELRRRGCPVELAARILDSRPWKP